MTENQAVQQKSVRRNRVAAAACFAASLITVSVVGGSQSATADGTAPDAAHRAAVAAQPVTGATAHPAAVAAAAPGLGSAGLVQSEDSSRQGLNPVGATIDLTGREGLSACSGEETMRGLTAGKATGYASVTWTFDTDSRLKESAASAPTGTAADSWEKQLVALVQECQDEPAGHWYYGAAHTLTVNGGTARWYLSYNGDGAVSGGAAVLRTGTRVAVVELTGRPTDVPASVEGVVTAALNRLRS
ncbi:hypothetical protein ACIQOW_27160 [Kitasatospora sp. NPDC091335]|uniref:hypothetical protein n=1 Tax=Kitasatospora sp. NPDC091335 TaxID=3364085 RepID=UPI0037F12328